MKKLVLSVFAVAAFVAAMTLPFASASPGKSYNRNDGAYWCYYNGHGYVVLKDYNGNCP